MCGLYLLTDTGVAGEESVFCLDQLEMSQDHEIGSCLETLEEGSYQVVVGDDNKTLEKTSSRLERRNVNKTPEKSSLRMEGGDVNKTLEKSSSRVEERDVNKTLEKSSSRVEGRDVNKTMEKTNSCLEGRDVNKSMKPFVSEFLLDTVRKLEEYDSMLQITKIVRPICSSESYMLFLSDGRVGFKGRLCRGFSERVRGGFVKELSVIRVHKSQGHPNTDDLVIVSIVEGLSMLQI